MSHYSVARRLAKEIPGAYYPNQYENAGNPDAHYHTTGPEISRQGGEMLGAVVATIGTGGTISGIGRYFKEQRPNVRIVAVDPKGSVLGHYFRTHELTKVTPYLVEGIGEDMVPKTVHFQYIDEFVEVDDRESFSYARRLVREEGLFVGGSSGAAVAGVLRWLSTRPIPTGSTVVVLLPDSGDRYLSKFYSDEWMREKGLLDDQGRAADLVRAKEGVPPLVSVEPTTVVRDALELLRRHEVSQLPVLAGTENVGSVTEEEILARALADETVLERTVSSVLAPPFPEVAADAPLGELLVRLKESRAVLVRESGGKRPVGILTRRDVFAFLSHPEGSHAV
jgi:cystathionine beta-synthase